MDWWTSRDIFENTNAKLYYYTGVLGSRWRLEGPTYSFWAADDNLSQAELETRTDALSIDTTHSPCGTLPNFSGWWTVSAPTTADTGVRNDRFKIAMSGLDYTATRWNIERLDYATQSNTGSFVCDSTLEWAVQNTVESTGDASTKLTLNKVGVQLVTPVDQI